MTNNKPNEALLVVNLGSPKSTKTSDVRSYLQEFLMDPYVVDIPVIWRTLLVYGPISLTRAKKSAEAYQSIWNAERGSPLIYHTEDFVEKLQKLVGENVLVKMAMRYAEPSTDSVVEEILKYPLERVTLAVMYPQFAMSSTHTALLECVNSLKRRGFKGQIATIGDFHSEPEFIEAFKLQGKKHLPEKIDDDSFVLMSFHGIPERHLSKLKNYSQDSCLQPEGRCCDVLTEKNKDCYRAQCFSTARLLAKELGLSDKQYSVSFQSRLGRTPWIKPYTDFVLKDIAEKGFKKVFVFCPSFVTDCLETLEEIQDREAEAFVEHGGESLHLVPCLNADSDWVELFAKMYKRISRPISSGDLERV